MFNGEGLLAVYSKIGEDPIYIPLAVGAILIPVLLFIFIIKIIVAFYLDGRRTAFLKKVKYVLLAIDIPKNNEQNLVAVEQIYVNLTAIKGGANPIEKWIDGKVQLSISFELVSIDGYIQFLIRTPEKFKDLVSSSIYSQYPEAEITPVEDYAQMIPENIGDLDCSTILWGTEFILAKSSAFPLKTYTFFEHNLSDTFNDPLTPLLEAYSRLGPGENAAMQIILTPTGDDWKKDGADELKKFLGSKVVKETKLDFYLKFIIGAVEGLASLLLSFIGMGGEKTPAVEAKAKSMSELSPGEKTVVEAIQRKLSLPSFSTKIRYYYFAKRELANRNRGVDSIKGAMSQFGRSDLNSFSMDPSSRTDVDYYFVERRVRPKVKRLARYYKDRSRNGVREFYLSTEELATIYHFPSIAVKTPMLPKSMIKRSQPPTILPTVIDEDVGINHEAVEPIATEQTASKPVAKAIDRGDLHNILNSLPGYDFDNDYYEKRFALHENEQVENNSQTSNNDKVVPSEKTGLADKYSPPENLPFIQD
jgi:hypothetical protein